MSLFTSSISVIQQPGVFLIEVASPTVIDGVPNGYVGIVGQGEWGPANTMYIPTSGADMLNTYFPAGTPHNSTLYYAMMRRKAVPWAVNRILGAGATAATSAIKDSLAATVLTLTGKYPGTLLNSTTRATAVVSNATDGVANHYKLTVSLTDPVTGSTVETYDNLSTIAPAILPDVSTSVILASATLNGTPTTRPANGTYTFAGGSNGSAITANDYNNGFANLATTNLIRFVGVDDCGDTIRGAVNVDLQAHVDAKTDRMCGMQGSATNALAAVLTDVANYRDDRVIYCGAWVNVLDDAGTPQQSPFWTFVASAIANLEPQQSHAWWDDRVTTYYNGIYSVFGTVLNVADDGTKNQCTQNGVCLPTRLDSGKWAALHDRTTNLAVNKRFSVTRRIKDYLALSIRAGIPGFVNGPNTQDQQRALRASIDDFLAREVIRGRLTTPPATAAVPNPVPYSIDGKSQNTAQSVAAGQYILVINGTTPAPMEEIIIMMNVGNTVVVQAI